MGLMSEYSVQYHLRLIQAKPPRYTFPTDLHVPGTEFCDVVATMGTTAQILLGMIAYEVYLTRSSEHIVAVSNFLLAQLKQDIESGKCILVLDDDQSVFRVVRTVTLCIRRNDERRLMQMGKFEDGELR